MTTLPLCWVYLECVFLSDDSYHLTQEGCNGRIDGWTDKNHQTIAVTLRLRFVVRVNNEKSREELTHSQKNTSLGTWRATYAHTFIVLQPQIFATR